MEQISSVIAGGIGTVLVAAIVALWRFVVNSNRKCEARNEAYDGLIQKFRHDHEQDYRRREELAWERSREITATLQENTVEIRKMSEITQSVGTIATDAARIVKTFCEREERRAADITPPVGLPQI